MFHLDFMSFALDQARAAVAVGEVPVGAVIVQGGSVLTQVHNRVIVDNDPTAHAEILAIRRACKMLSTNFLTDCSMYVTLEPCAMCAKAISLSILAHMILKQELYFMEKIWYTLEEICQK